MLRKIITQYNTQLKLNPAIVTNMGDVMNIQANEGAYCTPRIDNGIYTQYEMVLDGFLPDYLKDGISEYYDLNMPLFAYLEYEKIERYITERGGVYGSYETLQDAQAIASKIRDNRKGNYPDVDKLKKNQEYVDFWNDEKFEQESKEFNELLDRLEEQEARFQRFHPKQTDLTQQAAALVDAPTAQQYDFICTAPEGEWQELLQIIFDGADPIVWEHKRANYDPDWQAKASKKAKKREQARKRYAKNGRSVYPSKKHNNNGTFNMLPLAPV